MATFDSIIIFLKYFVSISRNWLKWQSYYLIHISTYLLEYLQ